MSQMLPTRYTTVREKILTLFNILNNRQFPVWIAPKTLMSTEQLRERYELSQPGFANDHGYYGDPQLRKMKIPQLLDIMDNVTSHEDLGFNKAVDVVTEIYESIQEYIALWCELMRAQAVRDYPPREELRKLESLAFLIFPLYKRIKPFKVNEAIRQAGKQDSKLMGQGLATMGMLFQIARMGSGPGETEISFISHIDTLEAAEINDYNIEHGPVNMGNFYPTAMTPMSDSLMSLDTLPDNNDWIFKAD